MHICVARPQWVKSMLICDWLDPYTMSSNGNDCVCWEWQQEPCCHYGDVIMSAMASQITSLSVVYSTIYSGADQRKHQSSMSLAFVREIHRWPVNSPHKGPVTQKMFPFDYVVMDPILACCLSDNRPLSKSMLLFCWLDLYKTQFLWQLF